MPPYVQLIDVTMSCQQKKERLRPVDLHTGVHEHILSQWFRGHTKEGISWDIKGLLKNMSNWTRAMPSAEDLLEYTDLVDLYAAQSPPICFASGSLVTALRALDNNGCITLGDQPLASARAFGGVIRGGLSKYREIAFEADKYKIAASRCTSRQKIALDETIGRIARPHLALKDKEPEALQLDWSSFADSPVTPPPKKTVHIFESTTKQTETPPGLDWSSLVSSPPSMPTCIATPDEFKFINEAAASPLATARGALSKNLPKPQRNRKPMKKNHKATVSRKPRLRRNKNSQPKARPEKEQKRLRHVY